MQNVTLEQVEQFLDECNVGDFDAVLEKLYKIAHNTNTNPDNAQDPAWVETEMHLCKAIHSLRNVRGA